MSVKLDRNSVNYYLGTKKSLSQKKGASGCDLRHLQMESMLFHKIMARIDVDFQAELNWIIMHAENLTGQKET